MRFYRATSFIFPHSFQLRIFAICFGAVHIPLTTFCLLELALGGWDWHMFVVLLLATLAGTMIAVTALAALLSPIENAIDLLRTVQAGRPITAIPVGGQDLVGELLTAVATASTENAQRLDRLKLAAEMDVLTGIRNRRGFLNALPSLLVADRHSTIALLDLDHFKAINDQFGHDGGDHVLAQFAARLQQAVRQSDVCARWGGEEFAVLFLDTDVDAAYAIMERLRLALHADPIGIGDRPLSFSCGLAEAASASLRLALRQADTALYHAKDSGRDRVVRYPFEAPTLSRPDAYTPY
jgi:diguanylate cyclase (GGDEF)-like protein